MSRWLKLTLIRAALAVIIGLAAAGFLVWYPARTARNLVLNQVDLTQAAIQRVKTANSFLDYVPSLSTIQLHQPTQAKGYAQDAAQASNGFKQLRLASPQPAKAILGIDLNRKSALIASVNDLIRHKDLYFYSTGNGDIRQADQLMLYQQKVSEALTSLLAYDAAQDMQSFSLKSADSQTRISLAQAGLAKIYQQLQAAKPLYGDPTINGLLDQVSSLRAAINDLSRTGEVTTWIADVNAVQAKIVANRTVFWDSQKKAAHSKLAQDQQNLLKLNTDWRRVATQNNIY